MKYIIANNQMGLLFKKQVFQKVLTTGEYKFISKTKNVVVINQKDAIEKYQVEAKAIANPSFKDLLTTIQVKENEVALHFVDGLFYDLLLPGTYSFFKQVYDHSFTILDGKEIEIPSTIDPSVFENPKFTEKNTKRNIVSVYLVNDGTVGILKVNGKFIKELTPGKYYFCTFINNVEVKTIDKRNQVLQITGQELLTQDKVTLRMNFVLTYKIVDSIKAVTAFDNYNDQLYLVMQLALREYVSTKTLDELLAEKHEIGKIILSTVKAKETDFGALFIEAGLKDIILPGDVREILNTILIAEKKALANVITRREETASTRSLLNTVKLMEENATLYKLKEMEYLERICDKVGSISLSSSGGIIEQLNQIIKGSK